jgi:hypothetical protein
MDAPLAALVRSMLATCLDIRAVWSIDHDVAATSVPDGHCKLLVFADAVTRARLHGLRGGDTLAFQILVVTDGDAFESACGAPAASGSLSRWAWRQTAPHEAFYEQARWAPGESQARAVVRVRRKALLVWRHERDTRTHERVYKD